MVRLSQKGIDRAMEICRKTTVFSMLLHGMHVSIVMFSQDVFHILSNPWNEGSNVRDGVDLANPLHLLGCQGGKDIFGVS